MFVLLQLTPNEDGQVKYKIPVADVTAITLTSSEDTTLSVESVHICGEGTY